MMKGSTASASRLHFSLYVNDVFALHSGNIGGRAAAPISRLTNATVLRLRCSKFDTAVMAPRSLPRASFVSCDIIRNYFTLFFFLE
jgi:hypothetical protein